MATGTFACLICGLDQPHNHAEAEVAAFRRAEPMTDESLFEVLKFRPGDDYLWDKQAIGREIRRRFWRMRSQLSELEAENARLTTTLSNVHRCATTASVALRNAGLDPYPWREQLSPQRQDANEKE